MRQQHRACAATQHARLDWRTRAGYQWTAVDLYGQAKQTSCSQPSTVRNTRHSGSGKVSRVAVRRPWEVLVPRGARGQGCVCVAGGRWVGWTPTRRRLFQRLARISRLARPRQGTSFDTNVSRANAPHTTTTASPFQLGQCDVCTYTVQHAQPPPTQPIRPNATQHDATEFSTALLRSSGHTR